MMKQPVLFSWLRAALLAVAAVVALGAQAQGAADWVLVWSDEFETDGPFDAAVWEPERGFVRNHEDQWYQPDNAFCQNGCLVIEGRSADLPNPLFRPAPEAADSTRLAPRRARYDWRNQRERIAYTSASLTTRRSFSFCYGRLEVRARIPVASGSWPAIWLLGAPDKADDASPGRRGRGLPWPSCGEIDVMEYYRIDGQPHILANACWGDDDNRPVWNTKAIPFDHFLQQNPQWASEFHVWQMDWTPQSLTISLDGERLNEIPLSATVNGRAGRGVNPFTRPQYLLLNLAMGGDHGGRIDNEALPLRYEIDYVRVYQHPEEVAP